MNPSYKARLLAFQDRLNGYYQFDIQYNQDSTRCLIHYNRIVLMFEENYSDVDFEHEIAHVDFLTEEGKVKYLHPKASINNDSEQVLFARYIVFYT